MANNFIIIENSTFIFDTNLSGDPKRDRFNSDQRKANLVIPDEEQAQRLLDDGFNVKITKPREGEEEGFVPRYYVSVKLNYESSWPPKVYLVRDGDDGVLLDADSICSVDDMWMSGLMPY